MRRVVSLALTASLLLLVAACRRANDPEMLNFLIESSPNNLDLRQGT